MVRLPGHVLPALAKATLVPSNPESENAPITLTIVLKRDDQAGFERYLHDLTNPHSDNYHRYLSQDEIADRFGPSKDAYYALLRYLNDFGFDLVQGARNRLTVTVWGTRAKAERAFDIAFHKYRLADRTFYAIDRDPAVPASLSSHILDISGLSSLASPRPATDALDPDEDLPEDPPSESETPASPTSSPSGTPSASPSMSETATPEPTPSGEPTQDAQICDNVSVPCIQLGFANSTAYAVFLQCLTTEKVAIGGNLLTMLREQCAKETGTPLASTVRSRPKVAPAASGANGSGQTVGLVEFDTFETSDVVNYLSWIGAPASQIDQLTQKQVNGGATAGPNQAEVLLDIDTVMTIAPGANVVVYDAPFNGQGSFQAVFNQMVNDGVSVISNSWAYCEDQTTLADVEGIDSVLQQAAAAHIAVFNGSGDSGSTCLDGSANTVAVPADSPNATAVGGSSLSVGPGFTYRGERWWDGSEESPPSGQGGFGISKFFSAPSYQSGLSGSAMRTVPDVVVNANPLQGVQICQASNGGCPSGLFWGGTSVAAPIMGAFTAVLNQELGADVGPVNPAIYPFANTLAFHNAASMDSDFAHVGLGSPNMNQLELLLSGQKAGVVDIDESLAIGFADLPSPPSENSPAGPPADGIRPGYVVVQLLDANGNSISGKLVSLTAKSGSPVITPDQGVSDSNGSVVFFVTDLTVESPTFTVTDTTDDETLAAVPSISFVTPPAAAASLVAGPSEVTADGMTPADITITLKDSLGRPTPGKLIQISQTGGSSVISGPNPPVTNASGQIEFTAVDSNNETITYSAVDVTDGNVPFPETGTVTFSSAPEPGCSNTFVAAPGYIAQPYATGFIAENFCLSGVCVSGCPGAFGMAFDSSGNLFVVDQPTGDIYKIPAGGGVANSSTLLTSTAIPSLDELAIDSKGNLYGGLNETGGNYMNGEVVTINQSTGAISGTVASGLTCPALISIDPLSGDLFADDNCSGGGLNNASLWRIHDPSGSPSVSLYTTLPGSPNGTEAFAPGGTIYIPTDGGGSELAIVSGTNGPTTPTVNTLSDLPLYGLGLIAQGSPSSSAAQFLISSFDGSGDVPGGIGAFGLTSDALTQSSTIVTGNGQPVDMIIGPDGCVYAARGVAVFRITDSTGACTYAAASPAPSLYLAPIGISPNPPQGSTQNFTATFNYTTVPDGTPVELSVSGANPQIVQANTTGGVASFSYTGAHEGVDTLVASATVSGSAVTSNSSVVTWGAGTDVTFLTLNQSPTAGTAGQKVNLSANLSDVSVKPGSALAGQEVQITLGSGNCSASTDISGNASCQVTASGAGIVTLSASFAGTTQYNPSNASEGFNVIASVASPTPIATATATATPTSTATTTATPTTTPTPVVGKLKVTPKRLNFGEVDVGSNKTKEVKITNAGKVKKKHVPLPILIEMESGVTNPFNITQDCVDDDLGPKSKGIPAGSCKVAVEFAPTAAIKYKGTLMIDDNLEPTFERSVKLEGTGKEPKK